jgi:hypothetical protein
MADPILTIRDIQVHKVKILNEETVTLRKNTDKDGLTAHDIAEAIVIRNGEII